MADIAALPVLNAGNLLNSYPEGQATIANTQANTALTGAQTIGAGISNAQQAIRLKMMQDYMANNAVNDFSGQTGPAPTKGADATADPIVSPEALGAQLRNSLFVNKAGTPQEQAAIAKAAQGAPFMGPEILTAAMKQRDTAVAAREGAAQNRASQLFEEGVLVSRADDPLASLKNIDEGAYNHIMDVSGGDTNKARDLARTFATNLANLSHQHTGRPIDYQAGQQRDAATGWVLPGGTNAQLSAKDLSDLASKGTSLMDVKMSDNSVRQQPTYTGTAKNLEQWMVQNGADPKDPRVAQAANAARAAAAPTIGAAAQNNAKEDTITRLAAGNPQMRTALSDKTYDSPVAPQNGAPPKPFQSMSESQKAEVQTYNSNLKELQDGSQNLSKASASAMSNFKAAAYLIDHFDGAITPAGVPGEIAGIIGKLGWANQTADTRWQIIKNLTNGAVGQLKETYGSRPAMFDVKVNLERAFPSLEEMDLPAARALISQQIDIAKYGIDTAQHAVTYTKAGKDPGDFATWNQKYFPREEAVNKSLTNGVNLKAKPAATTNPPPAAAAPKQIKGDQDFAALPSGTEFIGPDGVRRRKP